MPRFLILRFSSIGDIVLTTPVIRCLKQQVPDSEVHFLTKPAFASLLEPNPYIDKIWTWEGDLQQLLKDLKQQKFQLIIDLHHNLRSLRVKLSLRSPSVSFRKLNIGKYLHVRFRFNTLPPIHIVDRYMETLQNLGVLNDGKGLDHFLPENIQTGMLLKIPATHQAGCIVLVCGALKGTKRMPAEMLADLCRRLTFPIVLLGGKAESELGNTIAEQAGSNVFNACGMFSLHESAACVKMARVVITHDTGLMHIAAAFRKPVISIWGIPFQPLECVLICQVRNT
jgi:ADP-heptose:LPS heptosyltransferase